MEAERLIINIIAGNSYWHSRLNMKVWVKSLDRPFVWIVEDVLGYLYLAFEDELEEIE